MDPSDPSSFTHKTQVLRSGKIYHFVDEVPSDYEAGKTTTLLLLHGFPDLWYGWRYQIGPWVRSGFRVIVPDTLGYGGTDHPHDASEYTFKNLSADLASLLDSLQTKSVIVVGHDWGALGAYRFAQWQPKRVEAVITMSVPYLPTFNVGLSLEDIVEKSPNLGYQLFFVSSESTQILEENLSRGFDILYQRNWPDDMTNVGVLQKLIETGETPKADLLTDQERSFYLETFKKSGMRGPTNYYRTTELRFEEENAANLPKTFPASLPVLYFYPLADPVVTEARVKVMEASIPNLEIVKLDGCAHWVLLEEKDLVAKKVAEWVKNLADREE